MQSIVCVQVTQTSKKQKILHRDGPQLIFKGTWCLCDTENGILLVMSKVIARGKRVTKQHI